MARLRLLHLGLAVCLLAGCAVTPEDLHRWEGTQRGPIKLEAVLIHDKYPIELRAEALLSIIRMPPRKGQRLAISLLTQRHKTEDGDEVEGALLAISEDERNRVLSAALPELLKQIEAEPPTRDAEGVLPQDPSIPYKDAAFALLSNQPPLLSAEHKAPLEQALVRWVQTGFQDRIDNASQNYGVEQMMRFLGPTTANNLPDLIKDDTTRVDRVISLINDVGDAATKTKAAAKLVELAKHIDGPEWNAAQKKIVEEHNAKSKITANAEQVQGQIEKIRDRRFAEELFPSMKKIGKERSVIDYLLTFGGNTKQPEERRKLAMAALEGHADKSVPTDGERLFAIAKDDSTPDAVRDLAFTRLGELPKDQVLPKVYTLFDTPQWKVRWVAASMVLKMIESKDLPEFLQKLPASNKVKQGLTEGLSYGGLIRQIDPKDGPKPRDIVIRELQSRSFGAKMAALGFFYEGSKNDQGLLAPLASSNEAVPACEPSDDCQWQCDAPKPDNPKEMQNHVIKTLGEVVTYCIIPSLK